MIKIAKIIKDPIILIYRISFLMNNINASSPPKKANAALALDDQNVYVFGGNHSDNFVSIWVFDLSKDQWKELLVERADKDDIVTRKKYFISGQGSSENRNSEEMENSNDPAYRVIELMEDITKVCGTILDDGRIGFLSYRILLQPAEYEKEKNRCRFFLTKIGNKNATNADDGLNCVQEELNILDIDGSLTYFCHNDGLPTFHPIAHNSGRKFFFVTLNVQKINLDELNEKNAKLINKKEFDTFFIYELAKGESDCWEWQRISDEANLTLVNVNGDVVHQKEFMEILRIYADCSAVQCLFSFQKYIGIFRNLKLDEIFLFDTIERTFLLKPLKGDPNSGFPIGRVHSRLDAITAFQKENEDQILYCIGGLFYKDQGEQRSDECWKLNLSHFQWEFSGHKPIQRPVYDYSTSLSIKDKTIYIYGGITDCIRWPEPECNILQRIHL